MNLTNNETAHQRLDIYEMGVQGLTKDFYSTYQSKILMRIKYLQQADFVEAIRQKAPHGQLVLSSRVASEMKKEIDIPLRKLEPSSNHTGYLMKALEDMAQKPVLIPLRDSNGAVRYRKFDRLFSVDFFERNHRRYVRLTVPAMVLQYYMAWDFGYHRIDLALYLNMRHRSTMKLYQLLQTYRSHDNIRFFIEHITNMLSGPQSHYDSYASVEYHLLSVAREEMDRLYEQGLVEYRYTYRAVYDDKDACAIGRQKTGREKERNARWPKMIIFGITYRRDVELDKKAKNELEVNRSMLFFLLRHDWNVEEKTAHSLANQLPPAHMGLVNDLLERCAAEVKKARKAGHPINNPQGYVVNALKQFYNDHKME